MDTLEAIRQRKSYRSAYKDKEVSRNDILELLEAGAAAPSGCNLQTTCFIGVDDEKLVKKLADIYGFEWAKTSRAAIILLTKEAMSKSGVSYHVHDYCTAAENIYLAATEKGLATVWIEGQIRGEKAREMGRLLGVPSDYDVAVYMPLGYPENQTLPPRKLPLSERAWMNSYGGNETPDGNCD